MLTAYHHDGENLVIRENARALLMRINVNKLLPAEAARQNWRWLMYRIAYGLALALAALQAQAAMSRAADGWPSSGAPPVTL